MTTEQGSVVARLWNGVCFGHSWMLGITSRRPHGHAAVHIAPLRGGFTTTAGLRVTQRLFVPLFRG